MSSSMHKTPASLLERLRRPDEPDAWRRFVHLYTPLLLGWARRFGLRDPDAADLVQEVFVVLLQEMPRFRYDPQKRFRGWLWTIMVNKLAEQRRRRQLPKAGPVDPPLSELSEPDPAEVLDETEYQRYLVGRALKLMQAEFSRPVWQACWEYVVNGKPASEVAAQLGMSVASVYAAKCRVLSRLRQELEGLWD